LKWSSLTLALACVPRAYTAGVPMPLFDPEHEGSLAYLAAARLIYTPTKPQNAPEVVAAAPEEQSAASAPAEAVFEGNEFTV
jgi:hypothetical protein